MASAAALSSSVGLSTCDEFLLSAEGGAGFLTEARAETGVPLAPDRTDRVLATPPAVPFVVGVDERVGVRFAAAGEDEETLEGVLRPGVPVAGGLFAVAVDMLYAVCSCVGSELQSMPMRSKKKINRLVVNLPTAAHWRSSRLWSLACCVGPRTSLVHLLSPGSFAVVE